MKKLRTWVSRFGYECEVQADKVSEASAKAKKKMKLPKDSDEYMLNSSTKVAICKTGEHKIVKSKYESAVCSICGERFGWWCPKSPDHVCHYHSFNDDKGVGLGVQLIDETLIPKPKTASEYETDDECMFCGLPEERK